MMVKMQINLKKKKSNLKSNIGLNQNFLEKKKHDAQFGVVGALGVKGVFSCLTPHFFSREQFGTCSNENWVEHNIGFQHTI